VVAATSCCRGSVSFSMVLFCKRGKSKGESSMMRRITLLATASFALTAAFALPAWSQDVLPRPEQTFKGHIGRTVGDSTKDFPQEVKAPKGAPNILLILTDDVGFGASSTFGGPVPTPTMDRLANEGLRYTEFHTTALCSPTRAALLTRGCCARDAGLPRDRPQCARRLSLQWIAAYLFSFKSSILRSWLVCSPR